MKGRTLKMTVIAAMVFAGMMALAQIAEAAQAAPSPAPLAPASAVGKGTGIGFRYAFLGNAMSAKNTQLSLKINTEGGNMAISPYLGFGFKHNGGNETEVALGLKLYPTIAKSKQATFFGFGGVGAVIGEEADTYYGLDLSGGFGAEYFFTGLPNVGFSFEAGADFSFCHDQAGDNSFGLNSVGSTLSGGIHYYFD